MAKIIKTFRIEQRLLDEVNEVSTNASRFICLSIVAALRGLKLPRQEEIDNLITLNNELRRIAVNFNQSVRALNTCWASGESIPPELIQKTTEELAAFHQTRLKIDDLLEAYYGKK